MKKAITLLLALLLLSLAACGGKPEPAATAAPAAPTEAPVSSAEAPAETAVPTAPAATDGVGDAEVDFDAFLSGLLSGSHPTYSKAEQEKLIELADEEGLDLSFDSDGAIHITDQANPDLYMNVHPDGSFDGTDEDGSIYAYVFEWPDNELADALPAPNMGLTSAVVSTGYFAATLVPGTMEEALAYGAMLKEAGFTENLYEESYEDMNLYAFVGRNADGWEASFTYYGADDPEEAVAIVGIETEPADEPWGGEGGWDYSAEDELPEEFAFLFPDGTDGLEVYNFGFSVYVTVPGGGEAAIEELSARLEDEGYALTDAGDETDLDGILVHTRTYVLDEAEVTIAWYDGDETVYLTILPPFAGNEYEDWGAFGEWEPAAGSEVPEDYGFLFSDGSAEDVSVYDYGYAVYITVPTGGRAQAEAFVSRLEAEGYEQTYLNDDLDDTGTAFYDAGYALGETEIFVSWYDESDTVYITIYPPYEGNMYDGGDLDSYGASFG